MDCETIVQTTVFQPVYELGALELFLMVGGAATVVYFVWRLLFPRFNF